MAVENGSFEDVFPIEDGNFPCHVSSPECKASRIHCSFDPILMVDYSQNMIERPVEWWFLKLLGLLHPVQGHNTDWLTSKHNKTRSI